ncbi:MAG: hypothetical protein LN414_00745 [Candidatus Thermoplasmatota archaeon]|nr:hypothetical protein [Candidatus Thermoplasmatota archaeon]
MMVTESRSLILIALIATAVAFVAIAMVADEVQAQLPTITVNVDNADAEQTAFPTETENDILVIDGCLTLDRPIWLGSVVIVMSMEMTGVDVTWEASIDPPSHTFAASESQGFSVRVTVPASLPATTTIGFLLEFTATTSDIWLYDVTPDTARVNIAQYYRISRQYSTEPINIQQGDVVNFNFTVENTGNGADTFILEVSNLAELEFAGLTLIYDTSKRVEMGEDENIKLQLSAVGNAIEGHFKINLTITSEGSRTDPNYEKPVTNSAEWNVIVEPSIGSKIVDNLVFIVIGVVVLIVIIFVLVLLRRRKRARAEEEVLAAEEEKTPPPSKKRKKRPKADTKDADTEE